jgi:hypothetical protein
MRIWILALAWALVPSISSPKAAFADSSEVGNRLDVEIDPVTTATGGFAVLSSFYPKQLPRWRFGGGVFGAQFDESIITLLNSNNENFKVAIRPALALTTHRFFSGPRGGPYVGGALVYLRYRFGHESTTDEVTLHRYAVSGHLGYQWFPFDSIGLYLQPFVHLSMVFGPDEPSVAGMDFDERAFALPYASPVSGMLLFHIGYQF